MPEPGVESALDGNSRVAATFGDETDGVFLFERESSGQRSEPGACSGEGGAARRCIVLWCHTVREFERAPADGAARLLDKTAEPLDAVLADKRIGILGACEQLGLEHTKRWRLRAPACAFDCSCYSLPSRRVVVERENDRFEAELLESCDGAGLEAGAARGGDVGESLGPEVVDVEEAFDQHELPSRR